MKNSIFIPIVMASDNKYMPYTYVAVYSLLKNKNDDTTYAIYMLHTGNIKEKYIQDLGKLVEEHQCMIEFIDMGDSYQSQTSQLSHISHVTFYRLQLPRLLNNISKCIWLDGDVIVQKDLTELYNVNIENNYIAGVKDAYEVINPNYYVQIGIENLSEYVNAGVTVWNLDKMREDNLSDKFDELSQNTYQFMDQDILNISCFGKIKLLSLKYNAMSNFFDRNFGKLEPMYNNFVCHKDRHLDTKDCFIIHYCTSIKPWNKKFFLGKIWWKYAAETPYHKLLVHQYKKANGISFIKRIFSVKNIGVHKQIYIFGARFKIKSKKLIERKRLNQIIKNQMYQINLLENILKNMNDEKIGA